jgi:hypothetical protein
MKNHDRISRALIEKKVCRENRGTVASSGATGILPAEPRRSPWENQ